MMLSRPLILATTGLSLAALPAPLLAQSPGGEVQSLRAQIEALQARVAQLEQAPAVPAAETAKEDEVEVRFKGAPEFSSSDGWSFKPRGRIQYDVGHVSAPDGVSEPGLGFSNELRRARIGVEGDMPGGFGYTFEIDVAEGEVEIADALLSYEASDGLKLTVGQHTNFQSLEELTSSRFTSFMERAAFTDAFNYERRVGLSAALSSGDFLAQAGLFTDNVHDLDDENESFGADGRVVFAPSFGDTRLHFGASLHWRDLGEGASPTRYRQRPQLHSTDVRFVGTSALPVEEETGYGLEAAAIHGLFHFASEAAWLKPDLVTGPSPTFFGGYAEIGWFLTGESRAYKGGKFDRTRPRRSIEEGGAGAFQLNLRYDHLDLNSGAVTGGRQKGLLASLVWIPTDHVRFLVNYGRMSFEDAIIPAAGGDLDYRAHVIGARAQIDF